LLLIALSYQVSVGDSQSNGVPGRVNDLRADGRVLVHVAFRRRGLDFRRMAVHGLHDDFQLRRREALSLRRFSSLQITFTVFIKQYYQPNKYPHLKMLEYLDKNIEWKMLATLALTSSQNLTYR